MASNMDFDISKVDLTKEVLDHEIYEKVAKIFKRKHVAKDIILAVNLVYYDEGNVDYLLTKKAYEDAIKYSEDDAKYTLDYLAAGERALRENKEKSK